VPIARRPVVLDSYGNALVRGLESVPDILEAEQGGIRAGVSDAHFGGKRHDRRGADLVGRGVRYAIVTDGARPFAAADADGAWIVTPPRGDIRRPDGVGDSMIAGMLYGLRRSWRSPTVCGSGRPPAPPTPGSGRSRAPPEVIEPLLPDVVMKRI